MNNTATTPLHQSLGHQSEHPFDLATALQPLPDGRFAAATHPAWANMVGPFGGITAAVLLKAVTQHHDLLGEPISLTVNFCAAVADGAFEVQAIPARTNRSTQHWTIALTQNGETVATGTAVTAVRRSTWSDDECTMPLVSGPELYARAQGPARVEWVRRYQMNPVVGFVPSVWDGAASASSLSQVWLRHAEPHAVDVCALAALSDVFFPRIWLRRATLVPIGTVSLTVYFHATGRELAALADASTSANPWVFGQARAQCLRDGFFDQSAQIWSQSGRMLATSTQTVYFKE